MKPTDEELLHSFYDAGDSAALERLADRHDPLLARIAYQILRARIGSQAQLGEWDIDERLADVWAYVLGTRMTGLGRWPHQRLTALTWLIHLLCLEMDQHLGFRLPF